MNRTILVIEDNAVIRENTAELLSLHHYGVLTAADGLAGYQLACRELPDLILCDMLMPDSDGQAFLKLAKVHKQVAHIPLVFFSAGTMPVPQQQSLIQSANGFLKKPFLAEELLQKIATVLAGSSDVV